MFALLPTEERIGAVAGALADPTRRSILRLVRDDELAAGELARSFPAISRPAVSQHLRVLAEAGLVSVHTDGRQRLYRARPEGFASIAGYIEQFWTDRLAALKAAAERANPTDTAALRATPGQQEGSAP